MDLIVKPSGGIIAHDLCRPDKHLLSDLLNFSTSILSDCLDRFHAIPTSLIPLGNRNRFAGPAFTVEEIEGGNLMSHLALKFIMPGDVLVIDGKGITSRACWGGLQTFSAVKKGVVAVIIDGSVRDVADIRQYDLPVFARGVSPAGPHKGWGGRVNYPISCAGATIRPGDVIVGDDDGIVVVPSERLLDVIKKAGTKVSIEKEWFKKVEEGKDTADFLGLARQAEIYGIEGLNPT